MNKYLVWVRINAYQTTHTYVWADDYHVARMAAEAQYGVGNVLSCTLAT
jgi:hypothetical protein